MFTKKITVVAIAASLCGAPVCDAHAGSNTSGVFGFLNSNGTFRPLRTETPTPKAAATIFRGSFVVNFTFTIAMASNVPPTAPILCGLQAALSGTDTTGVSDFVAGIRQRPRVLAPQRLVKS